MDLTTKPLAADFTALLASTGNPCLRAESASKIITSKRPEQTGKESKSFVKLSRFAGVSKAKPKREPAGEIPKGTEGSLS
jgi:hypothetical protein